MPILKKYICAVLTIGVLIATGCSGRGGGSLAEKHRNITGAAVTWTLDGREYSANIALEGDIPESGYRSATVTVTAPEEINGVTLTYSGDSVTASVGSVSFPLPENTGEEVYRVIRSLSLAPEERKGAGSGMGTSVLYEAEMHGGTTSFDVTYGDDKYPESTKISWNGGEMTVKYDKIDVQDGAVTKTD